jgi:hypothetical protein
MKASFICANAYTAPAAWAQRFPVPRTALMPRPVSRNIDGDGPRTPKRRLAGGRQPASARSAWLMASCSWASKARPDSRSSSTATRASIPRS